MQIIQTYPIMTGKIARLMDRGYGFIAPDEGDKDIFFHSAELQGIEFNDLAEGDAVTFELEETDKGPKAIKVARA
jgi:cold shock protein